MKNVFCLILCIFSFSSVAQTNSQIVFEKLLSNTGCVLMTNAAYKSTFGTKVMFVSGLQLQGFDAKILNSNVLSRLKIDSESASRNQADIDAKKNADALARAQFLQDKMIADLKAQQEREQQQKLQAAQNKAFIDSMPVYRIPTSGYGSMGFHTGR